MFCRSCRWGLVAVAVLLVVVAFWGAVRDQLRRTVVLPNGTRITYLGATYGRVHTMPEWRFRWGWPPLQRVEHRLNTKTDALRLWLRSEGRFGTGENAARTADNRLCQSQPDIVQIRKLAKGNFSVITATEYEGLPADGRIVHLEFYSSAHPRASALSDLPVARLEVPLPKAPITERIKQPEPLPAVRRSERLTVRLKGFHWVIHQWRPKAGWMLPYGNEEAIYASPDWEVQPHSGNLGAWKIARIQFAPVGAGRPTRTINSPFDETVYDTYTEVQGNWDAPVYAFFVEFAHKPSGRREAFEFYVPPPPVAMLRQRIALEKQAQTAIASGDYARAIRVWDRAPAEFAHQAHYWRGYAFAMQGDYQRAIEEFKQAHTFAKARESFYSLYDREYDARIAHVLCLLLDGQRSDAAALAREYVQRVYRRREYLWSIDEDANTLSKLLPAVAPTPAQVEERTRTWKQEAQQRQNFYIIEGLHRIRAAQAVQRRDYRDALREFQAGRKRYQSPIYDSLWLAWLHRKVGQPAASRKFLDAARRELRTFPEQGHPNQLDGIMLGRALFGEGWDS
ncbi:MAG: tetratricopeptide repeat protein [Fimbriimonadales bacterium]|nr:tetratricopeptide repeat protein [Fimbriimonadales bacterium]